MEASSLPYKFQYAWGSGATPTTFLTNPIPATSTSPAASQLDGWPPATANPSGTPPNINDFNGIDYYETLWLQWLQAGGPIRYDSTFSGWNSGYPDGAILQSTSAGILWQSSADNNTTDPDGGSPANWSSLLAGRLINVQRFATAGSGTYTDTAGTGRIVVYMVGGGGGGGGSVITGGNGTSVGSPGSAGAFLLSQHTTGFSGGIAYTVGAAGVGGGGVGGTNGGDTTLAISGGTLTAGKGFGGGNSSAATIPLSGGNGNQSAATGGNLVNAPGDAGGQSLSINGSCAFGGAGGRSFWGGGGVGANVNSTGNNAASPGAGGSGTANFNNGSAATTGGNGAAGEILIFEYAA